MYCRVTQQDIYWDEAQRYANEISANMSKFFRGHAEYDTIEKQAEFFKEVVKALNNQIDDLEKFMVMYIPPKENVQIDEYDRIGDDLEENEHERLGKT